MAEQQTIKYALQWNNMTVDNVTFQTNNVVCNFNYPPNVPAYKAIMNFLLNCPLNKAFTNCPSVVYQNFLREFWSIAVAYNLFPLTDETEQCPLREFLIKFSVLNRQRPLTLDFNTFCSSTGLDYNNGKYVAHPTPKAVLSGNYSSTEQANSIQQLLALCLITGTEKDSVSPLPLFAKPNKGKSQTVTPTLPKSQGPETPGALSKKRQKPKSKMPPTETKVTPPKPMEGSEQSHSVPSGTIPDPQDLERNIQLANTGLPSTLNEGTRKSQPFPEGPATHPKDSGGNIQPFDRDLTFTIFDEGTAKTMPRPEGSLGDKDSGGNISPADIEPIHHTVADLSRTGSKYQVDITQSTRLRYRSLTKNKGKTSSEVEPGIEPLQLQTFADVQAFLLSEDELDKESDEEEVLAIGEDMDEDPQVAEEVRTPSPKQDQPKPYHVQESTSDSSRSLSNNKNSIKKQQSPMLTSRPPLKNTMMKMLLMKIKTDKLVETTMSTIDRSSTLIKDLYQGLNVITKLLKDISTAIKDDPATNKKIDKAIETFAKISTNTTKVLSLVKDFDFSTLQSTMKDLQAYALKQEEMQDTSEIKSMMIEIYQAFKGQSSSTPSSSVTLTLALTNIPANVEGGNATNTATEEPPFHTKEETKDLKMAILISSIQPTEVSPTQAQPITIITTHPKSSQAAPRIDKGKGIATKSDEDPSMKLVHASTIVHPDPDEEVKVPYMINGKMCYLANKEMQTYLDKEEKLKKAAEEARLIAISKPEVIKVVQEEAEIIGLDPKQIASARAGEKFKKAQDAEHQVLKREHSQKVKRLTELNKKRAEQYMWTMTNRIKPEPITDVKIHPNTKPDVLFVYRNNDKRNLDVH
ncbi:hypothetical protein Tco_0340155 [Tanacetum coccineum]